MQTFKFLAVPPIHGFSVRDRLHLRHQACTCRRCACCAQEAPFPGFALAGFASAQDEAPEEVQFQSKRRKGAALQQGWLGYQETASELSDMPIITLD